ncbi:hypothetical protein LAZ67_21002707 [Cordylochernes scorpioides]|uniref:Uncharacterized protein n=1 Tax=Cordylochernes scorpioides TaxID=51811 RepID=A0ABY6LPN6_9ARAC|nr:hypothetical protein LAZ67_21002707 [Cordylochernes scorpioides]
MGRIDATISMMEFCTLLKWEVMCAERVLVLVLCGLLVTVDAVRHTCPPDNLVSPCTCDGEGINCKKVGNDQGLKTALDRIGGGNYRGFWVQNANLRVLKASMFQKYKIGNFYLEVNNITEVQPGTFTGSEDVVQGISIFGNKLTTFPFTDLKTMKNLMRINIGRNQITDIPAFALSDHPRLSTIILAENQINSIGINAFQNLPMLQRLDLTKNALTVLGRYSLNINVHHPALQVRTSSIVDVYLLFQSVPVLWQYLTVGGRAGNPFSCRGCEYIWVVHNKDILRRFLIGFTCADGRSIDDLYQFNIGCP